MEALRGYEGAAGASQKSTPETGVNGQLAHKCFSRRYLQIKDGVRGAAQPKPTMANGKWQSLFVPGHGAFAQAAMILMDSDTQPMPIRATQA